MDSFYEQIKKVSVRYSETLSFTSTSLSVEQNEMFSQTSLGIKLGGPKVELSSPCSLHSQQEDNNYLEKGGHFFLN